MTAFDMVPSSVKSSQKIVVLDAKELHFQKSKYTHELSALAYKKGKLYALSDKGALIVFAIELQKDKIEKLHLLHIYKLRKKHKKLHSKDSEGLAWMGKNLLVSFEGKDRVDLYSTKGVKISRMQINKLLENQKLYQSRNKGLESVAYNAKYGIVTAPEKILKTRDKAYHRLYTKNNIYKFKADGSITGLAFIDSDNILVLVRNFSFFPPKRASALVRVNLAKCTQERVCESELLAAFDSKDGYNIDNFEGVTKVGKNRFLMVSDDNNNFFQKTLLVLFKIKR
jgi:hypothetical protein